MADDATSQLIKMITGGSTSSPLALNRSILGNAADLLSTAASYAQLLGTLEGPVAQAAVASTLGDIAFQQGVAQKLAEGLGSSEAEGVVLGEAASAAATGSALATAAATGVGAAIVIVVSFILAALTLGSSGKSDQNQAYQVLTDAINKLTEDVLAQYWLDKLTNSPAGSLWIPLKGDMDDLASQGTGGIYVKGDASHPGDVSHYHSDGMNFVNELTSSLEVSAGFGIGQYWQVPAQPAGDVPQSPDPKPGWGFYWSWQYISWYGKFPARIAIANSPSGNVLDPRTMLPVLTLGLQSYITLQAMANLIDPTQPTLAQFLRQYWPDFGDPNSPTSYINFLYLMYQSAVNGIVKTDVPSEQEILGSLWWIGQKQAGTIASGGNPNYAHPSTNPSQDTTYSWGAPWPTAPDQGYPQGQTLDPGAAFSGNGYAWNAIYGASETYPQYGFYGNYHGNQIQKTTDETSILSWRDIFTQAYIVSQIDSSNAVLQWHQSNILYNDGSDWYVSIDGFKNWTIPWLKARIILGSMARWKAIYLLNGFDRVWSILQALQRMAPPSTTPIVPQMMRLKQDNTIADGNWSARELINLPNVNRFAADIPIPPAVGDQSLWVLIQSLDAIARGNWGGPYGNITGVPPSRPIGFRDRLAAAAI
jgi:hypothetical protein